MDVVDGAGVPSDGRPVVVVGGGLAGLGAVRALRDLGWDGPVEVVGEEPGAPYDRPPLSKDFLLGEAAREDLVLDPGWAGLAHWRGGTRVTGLDAAGRTVLLDSGERLGAAGVVAATGARPLDGGLVPRGADGAPAPGVHVLRTLPDAERLRAALADTGRLVVVGGGFVGLEVASCARVLGLDVELVTTGPAALARALGPEVGERVTALHRDAGVRLRTGVRATRTVLDGSGRFAAVELADGTRIEGDALLVAVGSAPATDWVTDPAVDVAPVSRGVVVTERGATSVPGLVAVGDCTALRLPDGTLERQEHWTGATTGARTAVATLLGVPVPVRPRDRVPYVWSDQYRRHVQYAGRHAPDDAVVPEPTDTAADDGWLLTYHRGGPGGPLVAVAALDDPRGFTRLRRALARTPEYTGDRA